ncbi:COP23 domain-containing protein [Microcoleus sp. PH2017_30_WIL_O_A]|uniref:COP23 domain-containing protein n=1 Tax=Microcoleus sp. PH2017_30_WIL_O_A TaxID=2798840 RepID=UPI001D7DE08F|nr:COP23 domain-containing protein [Microcoleus sp. PH2017_30_WIL_O_A]MCC3582653.1 COP23 domain-containing protein [Microcoleus sp. PH2017_30_WIL_O_A]
MKYILLVRILSAIVLSLGATLTIDQFSYAQERTYTCGTDRSTQVPATLVRTPRGNIPMILWVNNFPPLTPRERCQVVSARFQQFADNHLLKYLRAGIVNGQPVLCVATSKGGTCPDENVLITLPPRSNANQVLERLLDLRRHAAGKPLRLSGGEAIFYVDGELYVSMEDLLKTITGYDNLDGTNTPLW